MLPPHRWCFLGLTIVDLLPRPKWKKFQQSYKCTKYTQTQNSWLWHLDFCEQKSGKPFQKTNLQKALHALLCVWHCRCSENCWTLVVFRALENCLTLQPVGIAENCQRGVSCELLHKLHSHCLAAGHLDRNIKRLALLVCCPRTLQFHLGTGMICPEMS